VRRPSLHSFVPGHPFSVGGWHAGVAVVCCSTADKLFQVQEFNVYGAVVWQVHLLMPPFAAWEAAVRRSHHPLQTPPWSMQPCSGFQQEQVSVGCCACQQEQECCQEQGFVCNLFHFHSGLAVSLCYWSR
jgi:hypothetical protein